MFRTTLHLLLIATVAACPLWCKSGRCASSGDCRSTECDEHPCCQRESSDQDESHPRPAEPADHAPCDTCQCICSGAVMESQDEDVRQQVENPLCDVFLVANGLIDSFHWQPSPDAPPGEHRAVAGRGLRILHASLLL